MFPVAVTAKVGNISIRRECGMKLLRLKVLGCSFCFTESKVKPDKLEY